MATPSSILSPSIATKKCRVTESIAGNKSKNNKHTVNQGKFHFFHYYLLFIIYILFIYLIFYHRASKHRQRDQRSFGDR